MESRKEIRKQLFESLNTDMGLKWRGWRRKADLMEFPLSNAYFFQKISLRLLKKVISASTCEKNQEQLFSLVYSIVLHLILNNFSKEQTRWKTRHVLSALAVKEAENFNTKQLEYQSFDSKIPKHWLFLSTSGGKGQKTLLILEGWKKMCSHYNIQINVLNNIR